MVYIIISHLDPTLLNREENFENTQKLDQNVGEVRYEPGAVRRLKRGSAGSCGDGTCLGPGGTLRVVRKGHLKS